MRICYRVMFGQTIEKRRIERRWWAWPLFGRHAYGWEMFTGMTGHTYVDEPACFYDRYGPAVGYTLGDLKPSDCTLLVPGTEEPA